MENLFWIGFIGAALAGIYALLQTKKVMSFSEGTDKMKQIAGSIREGANAYLQRQYKTVLPVFAVIFGALFLHEHMSGRETIGCLLIFTAIILAQAPIPVKKRKDV